MSGFLQSFADAAADVVRPLQLSFSSREELQIFLNRFGWDVEIAAGDVNAINAAFAIEPLITTLIESVDEFANGSNSDQLRAALDVIEAAKSFVDRLSQPIAAGGGLGAPFDDGAFWTEFAGNIVDDLIVTHLERRHTFFFALLHMLGVIRFERVYPPGAGRIQYQRSRVDWGVLPAVLTKPGEQLNDMYKWDVAGQNFDHERLLRTLERSLLAFRVAASVSPPRASLQGYLTPANVALQRLNELEAPILESLSPTDNAFWRLGFIAMPIPEPAGSAGPPRGLLVTPLLAGGASATVHLTPDITLTISGSADGSGRFIAKIYPGSASFDADIAGPVIDTSIVLAGRPAEPSLIIGSRTGSRLELDGFRALLGFKGTIADPEIYFSGGTGDADSKLRLKVLFNEGADAFVQNMAGGEEGLTVEVAANFILSSKHGASFEGSAALDFMKSIHLALGPISIEMLYVRAIADTDGGLRADLGVGLKGAFGPLVAVVENLGVRVKFLPVPGGGGGTLGNLDVQFAFKPPDGIGLSIDAGAFKGGGYLFFDFEKEEYAGALEFTVIETISLKAVGLLTTRMPDGSKGFSLIMIITAEFNPGIQLGFGFTLLGVGGLLGLNRTMRLEPLLEGVRTGAVNSIMFPRDVVANAPRIISDLRTIFPPQEGTFLIGPMAKIGWGTPTLISLSLGIIIEIPGNIAIVGVLTLILPDEDAQILVLKVNFVGAIEFSRKRAFFFAGLFDSHLLFMTIEGEMGLLMAFGDDANFVLTVGGFHPQFNPPPLPFSMPARVSIDLLNTPAARIRVMAYFGITSNSAQFGARAELYFGYDDFSVEAYVGFDALMRFSPLHFMISVSGGASLTVFGIGLFSIRLRFSLEGPTPWRARGSGSVSLLFFDVSADFDETWGESRDTRLPPIAVMPLLVAEFGKPDSWRALPPPSSTLLVTLRKMEASADGFVLHPLGALRVGQRAIPLDLHIDKVGTQKPSDALRFSLSVQAGSLAKRRDVTDPFALGQFQDMSDAAKLSRPAYEAQHSGVEVAVSGQQIATGRAVKRSLRYEEVVIDSNYRRLTRSLASIGGFLFQHLVLGASACLSPLARAESRRRRPHAGTVATSPPGYGVVLEEDNRLVNPVARFESEALAREYLHSLIQVDAANADTLHVVPETEVAA